LENINQIKKKSSNSTDLKSSTVNLFLNITIFVLTLVIIYMLYSIFIKVTNNIRPSNYQNNEQTTSNIIQIEILNGCGVVGISDRFTDYLRSNSYDVVKTGNYFSFNVDESLVIDRIGNMVNAYKVAKSLGIKNENVIQQLNKEYFLDVSVVIGRDYFNLTPFK